MKKLLTGILVFCVMCFCSNVATACDCGCEKAKAAAECECVKNDCECPFAQMKCKKAKCMKKCMKKCKKQYAKKKECCKKSTIECPLKCKKELNSENKKSVSEIITDSVIPEGEKDVTISNDKCDKAPCCKKCPCIEKCMEKCKIDLSKSPKKGCPIKDIIEE